ncbi:hypothetical protein [Streptococcus anginosus]|uniref:hypothetical protein n=1 Tax=Streptococcus anginosus TaxID=1328 RepID=UPI003082012A|nr:hypothetical protein LPZ00_001001 [Streptococcus anginosus]
MENQGEFKECKKEKSMSENTLINLKSVKGGEFNPIAEIGKLDYAAAKKVMLEVYGHKLSEEDYPLLLISDSPRDFFAAVGEKLAR